MENLTVFPEGMNEALTNLMKILAQSPHSFSLQISRYQGEKTYHAKVEVTQLAAASLLVRGDDNG